MVRFAQAPLPSDHCLISISALKFFLRVAQFRSISCHCYISPALQLTQFQRQRGLRHKQKWNGANRTIAPWRDTVSKRRNTE